LVARFFGSLFARASTPDDLAWIATQLTSQEFRLWQRMGRVDRVESLRVARRTERDLAAEPSLATDTRWTAAALLHDVGKRDCGLGTIRRAAATIAGTLAGPATSRAWIETSGFVRKVGLYLHHAEIGATAIRVAGGRDEVATWAQIHHDPTRWAASPVPATVCRILARADGERLAATTLA
jgi:hypothetical protein